MNYYKLQLITTNNYEKQMVSMEWGVLLQKIKKEVKS